MLFDTCPSNRLRRELDVALFADCTNRELRRIDTLSTVTTREAGQVLCREGEIGRECFVLLDGQVDVDTSGRQYTVDTGAPLGEIALLITNGRRSATLTARTDVTLLVFSRPEFSELMQGLPMVAHKILNEATRRLLENAEARERAGVVGLYPSDRSSRSIATRVANGEGSSASGSRASVVSLLPGRSG